MKNPPPSLRNPTDPSATQIEMSRSRSVGRRQRDLQNKKIFKKLRKVYEMMEAKAADMRAETSNLRAEMEEMDAVAEEKVEEFKSVKKKRDRRLARNLLMLVKEQVLWEILFPSSGND